MRLSEEDQLSIRVRAAELGIRPNELMQRAVEVFLASLRRRKAVGA